MPANTVFTVGHSNRTIDDFISLLTENGIEQIADVRLLPGSRRHPQFDQEVLAASLAQYNIAYVHLRALGGRRSKRRQNSPNTAWRVVAFAAYADYMLTPDFTAAFKGLKTLAQSASTVVMCAEALPWQCHRRLIADQFVAIGWQVFDIVGPSKTEPHELPSFAKIRDGQVTYPGDPTLFD